METIKLTVKGGELVAFVQIPPFSTLPEAVIWGSRVFQLETVTKEGEPTTYSEIFVHHIVDTRPTPDDPEAN